MSTSIGSWLTSSTAAPSRTPTRSSDLEQVMQALEHLFKEIIDSVSQTGSANSQGASSRSQPSSEASFADRATPAADDDQSTGAGAFPPPSVRMLASNPAQDAASTPVGDKSADGTATTAGGSGPNSITVTNTSQHDEKIGEFLNGGSTTTPAAEIDLKPGQAGTLRYADGQGGFDAKADASGQFKPDASRLEFYADQSGRNSPDLSYIDGRNASISLSDGKGGNAGDDRSIASGAPADAITRDAAGNATIAGWYDGSTTAMQDGGAYMQAELGTGSSYIHPDDDRNQSAGTNPMTLAEDTSQTYTAQFGDT